MIRLCARVELIINTIVQYIVIYIYTVGVYSLSSYYLNLEGLDPEIASTEDAIQPSD